MGYCEKHDEVFLSSCCGAEVVYDGFCAKCRDGCGEGECPECENEAWRHPSSGKDKLKEASDGIHTSN